MDQRAGGDALSSAGRSPAVAADGTSPSEDTATEEADGAPSPRPPPLAAVPGHGQQSEGRRRRRRGQEKQESGRAPLPRTEGDRAAPQGRAAREGRAGQRRRRAPGKRARRDPGQQEGHARLRDSSVRAHGALVRYSSSLNTTRQQRQGQRERFEPNGPGSANRDYEDEVGRWYQDRVSDQQRRPRFQPPDLGTSRPRRERERFEPYRPGSAERLYDGEDGSHRYGRYQHQGPGQQRQSRFQLPELGPSRPRQERFEQYELGSAKRGYDDEEGTG
ncbi:hypothetical protein THAOC_32424, partial [Thalassiosira oceanica]